MQHWLFIRRKSHFTRDAP